MTNIAFTGNMTGPAELRFTQSGKAVANVTVAVNRKRNDVEETDYHRVTLWGSLGENAAQFEKGTRVVVIGRLVSREYETKSGEKRPGWEVVADSFGPDVRFATVQVTRAPQSGGNSSPRGAQGQPQQGEPWAQTAPAAAAGDAWTGGETYGAGVPF